MNEPPGFLPNSLLVSTAEITCYMTSGSAAVTELVLCTWYSKPGSWTSPWRLVQKIQNPKPPLPKPDESETTFSQDLQVIQNHIKISEWMSRPVSKCGPWSININLTWEPIRTSTESETLRQYMLVTSRRFLYTVTFRNHRHSLTTLLLVTFKL